MNDKAAAAREWLAFLKCAAAGVVLATLFILIIQNVQRTPLGAPEIIVAWPLFVGLTTTIIYGARVLIRLTRWSIRTVNESEDSPQEVSSR